MIRLFEAFRGYGSQGLALEKYGVKFKNVGGCEIDKYADIAHEALHGKVKNYGDITKINALALPDMDLFTYSFPCQDISMGGNQKGFAEGSGTRSSLLWECQKIIELKRPKYLMMENVKNLVGKKNKPHFEDWIKVLDRLGYSNYWKVINAKWCGVPQNRERIFCVSILKEHDNGKFKFYDDFDSGVRLKDILEPKVDEKYYLSGKMVKGFIEKSPELGYINQDTQASKVITDTEVFQTLCAGTHGNANGYVKYMGRISESVYSNNKCQRSVYHPDGLYPTLISNPDKGKIYEGCRITGRNPDNPKSRVSGLPTVQMLEVNQDSSISNCLTTVQKDTMLLEKPSFRIRKLTPKECFRLMGVSDSDIDKIQAAGISNSQQYKMAGNSIVINCMEFLKELK